MNCGQCKHFSPCGFKNWGECSAPFPAWLESDEGGTNQVWVLDGHPNNYADKCEMFEQPNAALTGERTEEQ